MVGCSQDNTITEVTEATETTEADTTVIVYDNNGEDAEAEEIIASDDSLLIDNRTIEEYNGETSGYSYYDMSGRIEGAVFGRAGEGNSSSMLYYRNPDATMRDASEIEAMWEELGVDTDKHLSFFCGNGYRASEILWDAWMMGYENTSLYADGWIGWSSAGNDIVVGE